jgi:2-aminoadipate transaminase
MRLNFSSSTDEEIREGVRRIGKIVAQQVALYDTLTGHRAVAAEPAPPSASAQDAGGGPMADILELPRRGALEGRRSREA